MKQEELTNLLNKMTIDEKIGQMVQVVGSEFLEEKKNVVTGPENNQKSISKKMLYNVGSILNTAGAENIKKIQDEYLSKSRLKIPLLFMADIINGYKTIFPCPLAQGCSWNTEVLRKIAEISRNESAFAGINVTFSPMVDLARDARWGRCIESVGGEDPFLAKTYAKTIVNEYQKKPENNKRMQISCVKHFAAYGAVESGREYNTVDISKRELMEYYMPGYKSAIENGAQMIMTSFNILNGIPATINKWLLKDVLRKNWNFKGIIITDYTAMQECINHGVAENEEEAAQKAIDASVDIDMMSTCYANNLRRLINEKKITISQIDEAVLRILNLKNELGLFENPYGFADEKMEQKYIFSSKNLEQATKLTMSFPQNAGQCPIYYNHYNTGRPDKTGFRYESRYIDIPTESFYPFGYGLSYSKFVYSNLKLNTKILKKNSKITLKVTVKNNSPIAGKEIIQLYIQDLVGSVVRPVKELKAFKKEYFLPYEEKEITFEITEEMLKFYNENLEYKAEPGKFKVFVGTSSVETTGTEIAGEGDF